MITSRDIAIAALSITTIVAITALAASKPNVMSSAAQRRRGAGDLSRDQLDIGGDAEQMTAVYS